MVKRISSDRSGQAAGTTGIQPTRTVESAKVGDVEQVKALDRQTGTGAVRRTTRALTPKEQEELMMMIDEEADRMFGPQGLPESKKETVKDAVRMAIEATLSEEDEEGD